MQATTGIHKEVDLPRFNKAPATQQFKPLLPNAKAPGFGKKSPCLRRVLQNITMTRFINQLSKSWPTMAYRLRPFTVNVAACPAGKWGS